MAQSAADWYATPPRSPGEWRSHAEAVRGSVDAGWADVLADALGATGPAAERLERSARGRGVVVTTGQQPGLFGGPLYTWWKALSALALADALQEATGLPVAPVFWAATDDADYAEASTTMVAVPGGLDRLALPPVDAEGERLADVPLTGIAPLLARLSVGAGSSVYPQALELAARAYRDGETVGGAYVTLLRGILEPLGIAVLDAAHPAVRGAGAPLLAQAVRESAALERALVERERALRAAGFHPQVPVVRGRSLVFSARDGRRERIAIAGASRALAEPDDTLGPNVLLRPVMERAILPTAAYVAGPGELAYFAQTSAVADTIGAAQPVAVPRWSGTVIEPHVQRLLDRYDIEFEALRTPGTAESAVARDSMSADVRSALSALHERVAAAVAGVSGALDAAGSPEVPPAVLAGAVRDLERRIGRLERRVIAAAKREQTEAMRDLATLRAALMPGGKPQERALNLLPMLARHGPVLLQAVHAAAAEHARALIAGGAAQERAYTVWPSEPEARDRTR
jgi:bacillithiol biosynthesis cysteine-adding enzyme BshC